MSHTIHSYQQGSSQWHSHRATHFNASEAPAMMGASKFTSRSELLREKATGVPREHDEATQRRFAAGHEAEAHVRARIEQMTGDDFFPVTASRVVDGLPLSASYDGLTMDETIGLEVKLWNEGLAEQVRAGALDMHYVWQLEQQLLVVGAEVIIFCTGDADRLEKMEYRAVPGRREQLIAGWKQFAADLATYTRPAAADPAPTGRAPDALPALRIEITGAVTASNLAEFKDVALGAIRSVNRELSTDRDFADADKAVKWCGDVEDRIKAAKEYALSQTTSIEALFRTLDEVSSEARQVRLDLEKLVKRRKEDRKGELVAATMAAYRTHMEGLAQRFEGRARMPAMPVDFGTVIRGLKSFDSMADKLDTALANAKIESHKVADQIDANLRALPGLVGDRTGLTPDLQQLVLKSPEDFAAVVGQRVAAQRQAEEKRAAELVEKERARIVAEERALAEAKVRQEQEAEAREQRAREEAEALERRQREAAAAPTPAPSAAPVAAPVAANVVPMPTKAPVDDGARINLSDIKDRLHPIQITAEGLASLGFPHVAQEKASKLYRASDFPRICDALMAHIASVRDQRRVA